MDIKTYKFEQLPSGLLARWLDICNSTLRFSSPFFHPDFIGAVAKYRENVRVAVILEDYTPVGVFPFELYRRRLGRPVGGRLSDFQGIICQSQLRISAVELLDGCNLRAMQFDHWLDGQYLLDCHPDSVHASPYIDLSNGYTAYYRKRISQGSTRLKKARQMSRRLEREFGNPVFVEHDEAPLALELLLQWKSQQYRKTGTLNILRYPWVLGVMRTLIATTGKSFRGCMMTYSVGGNIVAAHLGMRTGSCVHWWIPSYDPALAAYSPGFLMLASGARHFADDGVVRIDLGRGEQPYKKSFTHDSCLVAEGVLGSGEFGRTVRRMLKKSWGVVSSGQASPYAKRATRLLRKLRKHWDFR